MKSHKALVFAGMGFELIAIAVAAAVIGDILDEKYGWGDAGFIVVFLLCFIGWLFHFIILIQRYVKESNDNPPE